MIIIKDKVVPGRGLGKKLGYPTANLSKSHDLPSGIYPAKIILKGSQYFGLLVVGAFNRSDRSPAEEVYLLDFDRDIYGETLEIEVGDKLREIRTFKDENELKQQIDHDIKCLRELLQTKEKWQK